MTQLKLNENNDSIIIDRKWYGIYKIGGISALLAAVLFRRNIGSEFLLLRNSGVFNFGPTAHPETALDWFNLIHNNRFVALILLNMFDIVNYALVGIIFLSLYGVLKNIDKSKMVFSLSLCFVGITTYFSSNQTFSLLPLSDQYFSASTEQQRIMTLAAGQAILAINNPNTFSQGTGILLSLLFVFLSGLIISSVMLRSNIFNKTTGIIGLVANVTGLFYFIVLIVARNISFVPISLSAPFLLIWYILIFLKLNKITRQINKETITRE